MKKTSLFVLFVMVLSLFLITAGCTHTRTHIPPSTPVVTNTGQQGGYTSNESLVAFVDSAVEYVHLFGSEKALAEFNNPNGSFIKGELYIYAYGFNGTTLAHPINPEKVGKTRLDEGAIGVFVTEMGEEVREGSGFYRFTYINPTNNRILESKLGYGKMIDDDWWLGSGIYLGPVDLSEDLLT
ncbi:cache domain-containing protein [Methanocalculus sp.]|uniref:cache domain-containing protein n=1 Tax=Methanocalculus sp. TaxID=2004547 RepID=UPI00272567BD|nr:cache domain-containing protein [Methanocalculus sp.]MDO8842397.1 cache domain-containing protein [Methanocalculus sp.]